MSQPSEKYLLAMELYVKGFSINFIKRKIWGDWFV